MGDLQDYLQATGQTGRCRDRLIRFITKARKRNRMSQVKLSSAVGRSRSYIGRIERKQARLILAELIPICEALDIDVADMVATLVAHTKSHKGRMN